MAKQTYTTGQVLTAAQMTALQANDYNWTVSAKTASYVLVAADAGTRITMSNAGATTITVNTALFTAGDTLTITNIGAGACTITAGTATVSTAGSLILNQYDSGTLYFSSTSAAIWNGANPGDITGVTAGTGISGGGTSGTVTITNSMATEITAAGDIIVGTGSGTFDNLPIGTTAQVLTADTTVSPYKVKWATPAAGGGMTLLSTTTLSGASTTISSIDQTYTNLNVFVYGITMSADATVKIEPNAATSSVWSVINYANITDGPAAGGFNLTSSNGSYELESTDSNNAWAVVFSNYASSASQKPISAIGGYVNETGSTGGFSNNGYYKAATAISSLKFTTSTGTFSGGTVLIYGVK